MLNKIILVVLTLIYAQSTCNDLKCYENQRTLLVNLDEKSLIGNNNITSKEKEVEKLLFSLRNNFIENYFNPPLPQSNWREIYNIVKKTKLYKLLDTFPKGAVLHVHGFCNSWHVIKVGTYDPTCYVDLRPETKTYGFFQYSNESISGWTNTVKARNFVKNFDLFLWNFTQFWTPSLEINETEMWNNFDLSIKRGASLLTNPSVLKSCIVDTSERLIKSGINHLELRIPLNPALINTIDANIQNITVRYIIEHARNANSSYDVYSTMIKTLEYMKINSKVLAFDLVGEEDLGLSLHDYAPDFIKIYNYANINGYQPLKYAFHCAETDNVTHANSNTFDAVLMNSLRLGHALGLKNHPYISRIVKRNRIGLEICPISNQLLRYFDDIRTHPGSEYISKGYPVTLNSDDPDIYGYDSPAPTPDYFMAFLSWDLTLSAMKELAENSILFSLLTSEEKTKKLEEYQLLYNNWILSF